MIKKIMCCCGNGLGSSMLARINVQDILNEEGIRDIEVVNDTIADCSEGAADLFIVSKDLEDSVSGIDNKIILDNLMDKDEIRNKLMPLVKNN